MPAGVRSRKNDENDDMRYRSAPVHGILIARKPTFPMISFQERVGMSD